MLDIKVDRVRKKAGLDEANDEDIQITIIEMVPYLESKIKEECLQDASILPILNLGATEIIAGQFLRESAGESEEVDLTIGPVKVSEKDQSKRKLLLSKELESKGWEKLQPYIKKNNNFYFGCMIHE
ncbi:hypothetical protein FQB35_10485 [Crassaminicella thermophila]|uniref:Uncharacterized protein n=1 Tax=Crassaminicella thermophila TaxID=2599308 RepID=A0A5C0SDV0_CRATE|nr:hypothetical protein [Crassaminicella thermophila]QEK12723.1 hypothetical protein FQB35_10485 [Crassaminicella thermophila]